MVGGAVRLEGSTQQQYCAVVARPRKQAGRQAMYYSITCAASKETALSVYHCSGTGPKVERLNSRPFGRRNYI